MKYLIFIFKMFAAALSSLVILSFFFYFYTFMPLHVDNEKGNTDYVWEPNSKWIKMTEGITYGKFDSQGYNNQFVVNNPDIIILGSSHMEAQDVFYNESTSGLLSNMISKHTIYNYSISGHDFIKVLYYLPKNISIHETTPKVIIIETDSTIINQKNVDQLFNNKIEKTKSHSEGIIGKLQKIPYIRQLYHQYQHGLLDFFKSKSENNTIENEDTINNILDEKSYTQIFNYLKEIENKYDTQIIIFYHPKELLNIDGTISFNNDGVDMFNKYSKLYNIDFLDMTSSFESMYYNEHKLPHGFITGKIGFGHLNKYGHKQIAKELYKIIDEKLDMEEQ